MSHQSKALSDAILLTKLIEPCATKLPIIIYNYDSKKTVPTDNRFLDKISHPGFDDMGERLSFDPLGKIFNSHQEKFMLASCSRKWSKDVHFSLDKRPRNSN